MNFAKILTVFILCFISIQFSYGVTHRVTDIVDGAPKSLRTMISLANPGDTLLIDVSGDMVLNSTLDINQSVTILGPFASHFKIDASAIGGTNDGVAVSANSVRIIGVGFVGVNANHYLIALGVSGLELKHCLFESKNGAGSAVRLENSTVKFESCSFNANNTIANGGSVSVMGTSNADFVNCTFFNNFASGFGSAVYVDVGALYRFDHCTFFENNGGAAAVYVDGSGALGTFNFNSSSSIYLNNGPFGVAYGPGITTTFATQGANVFHNGAVNGGFVSANDVWVNDNTEVNLRNSPITDGFGLKYLPIMDGNSSAIDVGGLTTVPPPPIDTRFAPRILYGDDNLESDAGAFEYSPYYVDNNDGGNGVPNSLGWCIQQINGTTNPGPFLIDFRFYTGTSQQINQTVPYVINKDDVFIHGYTEDQSKVPGPNADIPTSLTAASIMIGVAGNGTNGFEFNGQNCSLWGIAAWSHNTSETTVNGDGFTVYGCQFGVDLVGNVENGAPNLLFIDGGASTIGGPMHWNRNVFGNLNGGQGIVLNSGNGHVIYNNYIGFAANGILFGATSLVNGIHVLAGAVAPKIGGVRYLEGNHFGPCQTGVYNTSDNTKIIGNTFGLQYDGINTVGGPPMNNAVHTTTSNGVRIGEPGYWAKNVVTNFSTGFYITSSGGAIVENNYIGTDTTGNNVIGNVDKGVFLINSSGFQVGQSLTGRNVIAQSSLDGIHVQSTNGGNIHDNYIGLFEDGTLTSGSITNGINLEGCQNINIGGLTAGFGNIIAQTSDRLIYLNNSSSPGLIKVQGNTLGFDASANSQGTNPIGVSVQDHTTLTVIGDISDPNGANTISNCSTGILIGELGQLSQNIQIFQNQIYNNSALGIDIHAGGGLGVNVNDGIINAGNNEEIDYPEILSANSCDGVSNTQVALEITMPPGTYVVEIYTNSTIDPSNHGEGEIFLINQTFTTTASPETVVVDMGSVIPIGTELTATLTKTTGGTSEFSDNYNVTPPYTHTFTVTQPTCSGNTDGSIAIQAIGAIGFDITPGSSVNTNDNHTFGSLTDQSYDVSIIYSNCQFDTTIVLSAPPAPTVTAGSDQSLCANNPTVNLNGMFGGGATGLTWISGGGSYTSLTDPNATYTPTATEISNGSVTLTAQSSGSACASVTDDVLITFTPAPTIDAGIDDVICEGDSYTLNGNVAVAGGLVWSGGGTFLPTNTSPNAVYTPSAAEVSSGTVTLTATSTANGNCNAVFDDMVLTIESLPTIDAGGDQNICEGQNVNMSASATGVSSYNWTSTGSGVFSSNVVLNPTYTPSAADISSGSVTLTMEVSGTGACSSSTITDDMTVTITPLPDPGTNGSITFCDTDPSSDLFNQLGGTPDAGGMWSGPSSLTGGSAGTFDPSVMSGGSYTYQVTNGSCTETAVVTVTVNNCSSCSISNITATPSACDPGDNLFDVSGQITFSGAPTTGQLIVEDCNGNQVTYSAPFVSPVSYIIPDIVSDGAWCNVTAYFTDNAGCTATSTGYNNPNACGYSCTADAGTFTATISNATVTGPITLCYGDTLNILSNGDNVDPLDITPIDNTETYRPGLILLEFSCNPSVTPPASYAGPCFVAIHDLSDGNWDVINNIGDGSTRYFVPITAYDTLSPKISHTPGPGFCYDFGTPFQVTFLQNIIVTPTATDISCYGANDGAISVIASNGSTPYTYTIDGTVTNSLSNATPGDHFIEVSDANGCEAFDTVTIIEPPEVIVTAASIADDTCNNGVGEVVLSASGGATGPYYYNFNSGGLVTNDTYSNLGAATYTAYAQDGNSCNSSTIQVTVGNYTGPDPTFTYADFCPSSNPGPTVVNTGGTFSFVTPPGDGATINANSGVIFGATSGTTYQVEYQIGPCPSNIFTVNVTANQVDDPSFSYDDFCINNPVGPYNIATPGGDFYFSPLPSDGATIDPSSGIIYGATQGNSYDVIYETPNCTNTDTITVVALAAPVEPILSTGQDTYCPGDTIQVVSVTNNNGNNTTYNWYLNGSLVSNGTATPTDFNPGLVPGQNEIYVVADSGACSTSSQTLTIYLSDSSAVGVVTPVYVCVGTEANLNAFGGSDYFWSGDYSFDNDLIATPAITVNAEGWAQVEVTDQYGCLYRRAVEVLLEDPSNCDVNTYNAFSPNGDGSNETWVIDGIAGKNNRVVIFNRWGEEIKAFDNYNNQDVVWDGTNKRGGKLPSGTYYYIIEVDGQKMSGWVQIVM